MPNLGDNGWERWRGASDVRIKELEDELKLIQFWKDDTSKRIAVLETKMVVFAALAAALGSMIPSVLEAAVKYLGGQ